MLQPDALRIADGGQIEALIPFQQFLLKTRKRLQLSIIEVNTEY